ncbi:hypothetical protein L596_001705 [Steinernema carpocapsae]|uniref:GMP synthase (glutamine-hydrolyzing) n=1 Tax=Steinernema carpocapsae TaxID=34508 RepID=A0A4U8UP24_STECR|nr:hypothetical protein L596_001705 [Steinernema carpocapsae]
MCACLQQENSLFHASSSSLLFQFCCCHLQLPQTQLPLNDSSLIVTLDQHDRKRIESQPSRVADEAVLSTCSTERSPAFVAKNRVGVAANSVSPSVKRSSLSNCNSNSQSTKLTSHHTSAAGKQQKHNKNLLTTSSDLSPMKRSASSSLHPANGEPHENGNCGSMDTDPPQAKQFVIATADNRYAASNGASVIKSTDPTLAQIWNFHKMQPSSVEETSPAMTALIQKADELTKNLNESKKPKVVAEKKQKIVEKLTSHPKRREPKVLCSLLPPTTVPLIKATERKDPEVVKQQDVQMNGHQEEEIPQTVTSVVTQLIDDVGDMLGDVGIRGSSESPIHAPLFNGSAHSSNVQPELPYLNFKNIKLPKVAILDSSSDFGITAERVVRECGFQSESFVLHTKGSQLVRIGFNAIIICGDGVCLDGDTQSIEEDIFTCGLPILGIGRGFHLINKHFGGHAGKGSIIQESLTQVVANITSPLFTGLSSTENVYFLSGDYVESDTIAPHFNVISTSSSGCVAGIANEAQRIYAVQFNPEHARTKCGKTVLTNFLKNICDFQSGFNMEYNEARSINEARREIRDKKALVFLSGGLLSTVTYKMMQRALGKDKVFGVHVDTGLMRMHECDTALENLKESGIEAAYYDCTEEFLKAEIVNEKGRFLRMPRVINAEDKRKLVVETFSLVKSKIIVDLGLRYDDLFVCQSTTRLDMILREFREMLYQDYTEESMEIQHLRVIHPLQDFYREEIVELGKKYGISEKILYGYQFPITGLSTRIMCSDGPYLDCHFDLIQERLCWLGEIARATPKSMRENLQNPEYEECVNNLSTDDFTYLRSHDIVIEATLIPMRASGFRFGRRIDSYVVALTVDQGLKIPWEYMVFYAKLIVKIIPAVSRVVFAFGRKLVHAVDDLSECNVNVSLIRKLQQADFVVNNMISGKLSDGTPAPWMEDHSRKLSAMPVTLLPVHFDRPEYEFPSRNWCVCIRPITAHTTAFVKPAIPGVDLPEELVKQIVARVKEVVPFVNRVLYDLTSYPPGTVEWE